MSIIYVLLALLMLGIMVTVHEWGHFIAARLTGIPVREFAIGFGPKLIQWKSKKYETVFTLRLIPAGGYCAFYGEDDPDSKADEDPRAMRGFPVWKRLVTVFMGPCMNFVLAFLVGLGFYWIGGLNAVTYGDYLQVQSVNVGSAADQAGFKEMDLLKQVDGTDAAGMTEDGTDYRFRQLINERGRDNEPLNVVVERGGEDVSLTVVPQADSTGRLMIGIVIAPVILEQKVIRPDFLQAAGLSGELCVREGGVIIQSLGMMVRGDVGLSDMSGPVGVIRIVAEETQQNGAEAYILLLIFISVNLGLVNLMPIPGLDGAQIILLLIEAVRRKPLSRKTEAYIKLVGFAALMVLFVTLTFQDVTSIFGGGR